MNAKNLETLYVDAANQQQIDAGLFSQYMSKTSTFSRPDGGGKLDDASIREVVKQAAKDWRANVDKFGSDSAALSAALGFASPGSKLEQTAAMDKLKGLEPTPDNTTAGNPGVISGTIAAKFDSIKQVWDKFADFFGQFVDAPLLIPITMAAFFIIWFSMQNISRAR